MLQFQLSEVFNLFILTRITQIFTKLCSENLLHKAPSVLRIALMPSGWFVLFVAVHGFEQ